MPRSRKTREIGAIPLDPRNVKKIVEVSVKQIGVIEKVEKPGIISAEKLPRKRIIARKTRKKKGKKEEKIEEIEKPVKRTGKGEYILVITEKPQAAEKIAFALGTARKVSSLGVPYFEVSRNGEKIVVAAAAGHLFTLVQKTRGQIPVFDLEWRPSFEKKAVFTKKFYDVLKKLCRNAKNYVVATDYDIEGEVIGWNILRFICGQEDAKRMKYSTLTAPELGQAYENLMPTIDWGQAIAGETRHYLDWMYGINLSRALMEAIKKAGSFKIMSIGRVQGPALRLVVDKEIEIQNFKPVPFWQVFIRVNGVQLKHVKDITDKKELEKFEGLKGKIADVKTAISEENILPPAPFDLTTLQTEVYRFFKITPARTLQIAQQLYLSGLISYPRTSSQKIPEAINAKGILSRLAKNFSFVDEASRSKPIEGKKSDPAHPSIYPTGEQGELDSEARKIYELIVKRFVSCFCEDAIIKNKSITAEVESLRFTARALKIEKLGWMKVYPAKPQEKELKDLNGKLKIDKVEIEEKETQPPHRYTPASIVSELAKRNLGTKATRAGIVETLYDREYVEGQSIKATLLGVSLIETLEKYSPIIVDENLTRDFEKEMDSIITAKKELKQKEDKIINKAKDTITKIISDFKKSEEKIGKSLLEVIKGQREKNFKESIIMKCPVCQKGELRILFNRAFRRFFVACSAYPDCKTTFSLPPNGLVKKTDKICEACGWPMLIRLKKGGRPWIFCFNPNCSSRKQPRQEDNSKEQ
jgi:DNA topoisomerase-1